MPGILAITDDPASLEVIRHAADLHGMQTLTAAEVTEIWMLAQASHPEIILLDAATPQAGPLLQRILDWDPASQVLLMTDHYSAEAALEGIRLGARDCLPKPLTAPVVSARIHDLLGESRLRHETLELDEKLLAACRFHGMVGRSPQMIEIFARIRRVAPHYRIALVTGATGTGKELVAQALHALSPVANRRFVVCNCSAIVETLFESELFGHVRGAFTGATQDRAGLFEYAQGGTVFLDEIADMPLASQSKLLRVLQNQEVQRVGSSEVRKVDVRVIAATNRDVPSLIAANHFREDLYYRLSMVELKLPPLAERKEDLPLLERHFVGRFAASYGKRVAGISRRAQALLARHNWPGNVRELENVLGHACMLADAEFLDLPDFPEYLVKATGPAVASQPDLLPLSELERHYTQLVLERVGGNKLQAAQILGISRATLYRMLRDGAPAPAKALLDALTRPPAAARLRIQ